MRRRFCRRLSCFALGMLFCLLGQSVSVRADDSLPWEKDFATAKEIAIRDGKPLMVMMTATWCGPCKSLEQKTLPEKMVRKALSDFVWVQAFEDKEVEKAYQCHGYPTLAFIDPKTDKVFSRSVGYKAIGPFLRGVLEARKSGKLDTIPELEEIAAKIFIPDMKVISKYIEDDDAKGLKDYLQPASRDILRESNFLLVKLNLPESIKKEDVLVTTDRAEHAVSESGLLCIPNAVGSETAKLRIIAPGCKVEDDEIHFKASQAVATKVVSLSPLTAKDSVRLSGRVFLPNGNPASEAIVRIADIDWVKTDKKGNYKFAKLPAGEFEVRVECPGGELQDRIKLVRGKPMKQDAKVNPVATVGIRWALQLEEGSTKFTGDTVREGEAYFSAQHARFSLERGMETRMSWGSDFMIRDDIKGYEQHLSAAQREAIASQPGPQFFFWLFDGSPHGNGIHLEAKSYDAIQEVNGGDSFDPKKYFQFVRGEPLKVGQTYTVYCCKKKQYAKFEIIDLSTPVSMSKSANGRK